MRSIQETARVPWNHGRTIGPKPPLKPKHIWGIRTRLQHDGRVRDLFACGSFAGRSAAGLGAPRQ